MRDQRLVRVLECLDHFLVIVEQVPDALARVHDVVEIELELFGEEPLDAPLELPEGRPLRADDLPVGDDLLLHLVDVAHALLRAWYHFVDLLVDLTELEADLVEDREAVVVEVVEDLVEQPARPAREQVVAQLLVVRDALEEARDGTQLDHREGDDVVGPDKDVELAGVQPADVGVVDGEMKDGKEVGARLGVRVLVDLRPLAPREDVLDVERVPAEAGREAADLLVRRSVEVDPGEAVGVELVRAELARREIDARRRTGPARTDARQARHRY